MQSNEDLETAMYELKQSIDKLVKYKKDESETDNSMESISSLKGSIAELMQSNEELRKSILNLNAAVNNLNDRMKNSR